MKIKKNIIIFSAVIGIVASLFTIISYFKVLEIPLNSQSTKGESSPIFNNINGNIVVGNDNVKEPN